MPIDSLAPDVLEEIFVRVHSAFITQKFTISHVSQAWRAVALTSPRVWSTFTVNTKADAKLLPYALNRTGDAMDLDVRLEFTTGDEDWPVDALKALVPYTMRLARFCAYFRVQLKISALLDSNLDFSRLRVLEIEGPEFGQRMCLSFRAPNLEHLKLSNMEQRNWPALFVKGLRSVHISMCNDADALTLAEIFPRCPELHTLILHTYAYSSEWPSDDEDDEANTDTNENDDDPDPESDESASVDSYTARRRRQRDTSWLEPKPLAPNLKLLDVRIPMPALRLLLNRGFSDTVLPTIAGSIYNGHYIDWIDELASPLLRGCGNIVAFKLFDESSIEITDEAGHVRRLDVWNDDSSWEVGEMWEYLSTRHGANKTVRTWQVRTPCWEDMHEAFKEYPPLATEDITVILPFGYEEVSMTMRGVTEFVDVLQLPAVHRVEFFSEGRTDLTPGVVVAWLASIPRKEGQVVDVCIGDAGRGSNPYSSKREEPQPTWVKRAALREVIEGAESGIFRLCDHCKLT